MFSSENIEEDDGDDLNWESLKTISTFDGCKLLKKKKILF